MTKQQIIDRYFKKEIKKHFFKKNELIYYMLYKYE